MYISRITLDKYRNYGLLRLDLAPGLNVFLGENAQGKTNLLEAVYFTSIGRSMRTPRDKELIMWGEDRAGLRADAVGREGSRASKSCLTSAQINAWPSTAPK